VANSALQKKIRSLINGFQKEPPSRTPSLVATLFGDVVESHGREIWLGSLTELLAPLGVNERLARTAVYRLSQDKFIESTRIGRRSVYRLTAEARKKVSHYERLIYYPWDKPWDGDWTLVFTGTQGIKAPQRAILRKRLSWLGYGIIAPNVYGHPTAPIDATQAVFSAMGLTDKVVVLRASNYDPRYGLGTKEMVRQCFSLSALEKQYTAFIKKFAPLAKALENNPAVAGEDPQHCFMLRIMLIHHYRRILLQDPELPLELLPDSWIGQQAQTLCAAIYRPLEMRSEEYILACSSNQSGPFKPTTHHFFKRFSQWADR
jgi:phenylacetic acid degradation operon negative regulatory protein